MLTIERLFVAVSLDQPAVALEQAEAAAQAGDRSWQQWVAEYESGAAMIVRLDVMVEANDGSRRTIETSNRGVFIEAAPHPPQVERQISEIVSKDFPYLAHELSLLGHQFSDDDLNEMYVHVELGADLREVLMDSRSRIDRASDGAPRADVRLSPPHED